MLTQNDEACPGGNPCPAAHYQVMVIEADNQWEMQTAAPPVLGPWFGEADGLLQRREQRQLGRSSTCPRRRDHAACHTGVSVHNIGPSGDKMFAELQRRPDLPAESGARRRGLAA